MLHHGAPTSKRTMCWSNMPEVSLLDLGVLKKEVKEASTSKTLTRISMCPSQSVCQLRKILEQKGGAKVLWHGFFENKSVSW